nr:MAG TPA: hypothetical protein [Caudoviricetes sp.]
MLQFSSFSPTPSSPIFTILTIKKLKILIVSSLFFLFNLKVKYFLKKIQNDLQFYRKYIIYCIYKRYDIFILEEHKQCISDMIKRKMNF